MRICFPFVGDAVGGSHICAAELITKLPSTIEAVVLLHRDGPLADYLKLRGIEFERAPRVDIVEHASMARQILTMGSAAPRLANFLRARRIDLVHTNDARMHMTWLFAAKLCGARLVWHQHSATGSRRLAVYMRIADAVVTISRFCRDSLPHPIAKQARIIDNPFDTKSVPVDRPAAREKLLGQLGAEKAEAVVAFVGNFTEQKRPTVFLEMARQLTLTRDGLLFAMFGEDREPMRQQVMDRIIALGLRDCCFFMGPHYPIEPWIAGCDVLVAPAVAEGSGRAVVEAMLMGTPVVATNDGGHCEIISHGETGYLVPADNPERFAAAVAKLLSDRTLREAITLRARTMAKKRFTAERHVKSVVALYRELIR